MRTHLLVSSLLLFSCSDDTAPDGGGRGGAGNDGDAWTAGRAPQPETAGVSLVLIEMNGQGEPEESFLDSSLSFIDAGGGAPALTTPPAFTARAAVRVRGQSSATFDKKSYRVEFRDEAGSDVDLAFGHLPPQSDFVLHGPFVDKSLLRNAFAYDLGPAMGLLAPRFSYAELYLNPGSGSVTEDDYRGFYLIVESIKNAPSRLNLEQLDAADVGLPAIQGGYIFKFELDVAEPPLIQCSGGRGANCFQDLELYDPEPPTAEQAAYLQAHIQAFHDALMGQSFADASSGYAAYADVPSFVNYFVLQEFTRNLDAYIRSLYFHKGRDTKITAGPLWDYNLMGGTGLDSSNNPIEGFQHAVERNGNANGWFQRLLDDPAFVALVRARYRELRANVLSDAGIDARINRLASPLAAAAARNFERWDNLTERQISFFTGPTDPTWEGQVSSLRAWLKRRAAWLDANL